jgi:hypothetical protein
VSSDGAISLFWGDGEQSFRFGIGQFRELQENVNRRRLAIGAAPVGPMSLLNALRGNDAWPDDVRDVLRIGLIGGGMKPQEAHLKMVNYFDAVPPLENMKPAFVVLLAGLAGPPGAADGGSKKKTKQTLRRKPQ